MAELSNPEQAFIHLDRILSQLQVVASCGILPQSFVLVSIPIRIQDQEIQDYLGVQLPGSNHFACASSALMMEPDSCVDMA